MFLFIPISAVRSKPASVMKFRSVFSWKHLSWLYGSMTGDFQQVVKPSFADRKFGLPDGYDSKLSLTVVQAHVSRSMLNLSCCPCWWTVQDRRLFPSPVLQWGRKSHAQYFQFASIFLLLSNFHLYRFPYVKNILSLLQTRMSVIEIYWCSFFFHNYNGKQHNKDFFIISSIIFPF